MSFGQFNANTNTQDMIPFSNNTSFQGSNNTSIVAPDQHHQPQTRATAPRRGQPTQKRQPHNGAKSHKLLDQASFQNLFVARLPRSFDNDDLLGLFAEFCPTSAVVMMDMNTGKSKGFGFVTFKTEQEGKIAADAMSPRTFTLPQQHTPTTTTATSATITDAQRFTLEIKASTFNGQRIVVESRYVYFRNFPAQLFEEGEEGFTRLRAFLGHYGTVEDIDFHGNTNTSSEPTPARPNFQAPLLVSFASQAEAAVAIHECHGKILFPQLSQTPVMAKYADMTTVKAMDRQNRRQSQSQSIPGSRNRSTNNSPSPQSHALSPANSGEVLPYPALAGRTGTNNTGSGSNWGSGDVSPSFGSFAGQQQQVGNSLAPESVCTATSGPFPQLAPNRMSFGSNGSSTRRSSSVSGRGGARTPQGRSTTTYFRNDPYNRDGYVVVSSSASQSSRLSTRSISSDMDSFEYSVGHM